MGFNYCPGCGEELVQESSFCHSCGRELEKNKTEKEERQTSSEDENIAEDLFIDDFSLENLDFNPYATHENENREIMEEQIEKVVEENELTIGDLEPDDVFLHMIIDKIFERSARLKVEEFDEKSMDIRSITDEMES